MSADFQDLLDLKDAELDSLRLELEEAKGTLYAEYAKTIEFELATELEKQATQCLQLETEKKQLETTISGMRVSAIQLEVYTKNREIEELTESHQKEVAKLKKENNAAALQRRKAESEGEEAKKALSKLEKELTDTRAQNQQLALALQSFFSALQTLQESSTQSLAAVRGSREPRLTAEAESPGLKPADPLQKSEEQSESRALTELDKVIRALSQGSLT